jgi:anaerobic ribonucleoside-triphosphate reductase activating protein
MVPLSLSDYRGEPACVIFFSGCNYDCGYCHNWALREKKEEHLVEVARLKEEIKKNALITACKVSGGEPLLQPEALMEIGRFAKSLGLKFGIDTNGTLPQELARIISLLDLISLDIKTALNEADYRKISGVGKVCVEEVEESLRIVLASKAYADLRMVIIPGLNDGDAVASSVAASLRGAGYVAKASKGEASLTLIEFVPDHARLETLRNASNTPVDTLKRAASQMHLPNVRITHRVLGSYVPADDKTPL